MRISLGKVVLTGTGSAFLIAPLLAAVTPAQAAPARVVQNPRAELVGPPVKAGDHGAAVKQLQQRLKSLEYDPGKVDGKWGQATSYAVWAFQKVNHIKPSSKAGTKTWAALALPRWPKPMIPNGAKNRAEVDLKHQLLSIYKDDRLTLISHISSGTEKPFNTNGHTGIGHTPRGNFRVYRKAPGWETSPLGRLYKANYFDGGYAIHGEPAVPLQRASHGCVRVPMGTSSIVYRLLPMGTRVYVRG